MHFMEYVFITWAIYLFIYWSLIWAVLVLDTGVCCLDKNLQQKQERKKERKKKEQSVLSALNPEADFYLNWNKLEGS